MVQLELANYDRARTLEPRMRSEAPIAGLAHTDPELRAIAVLAE
jgi:hypothetical protein